MIQLLERYLRTNWNILFSDKATAQNFYFILKRRLNKYQIFVFGNSAKQPICIMKIPFEEKGELFDNELKVFLKIDGMDIGDMRDTIPKVLYAGEILNRKIILESVLPGTNMIDYIRRKNSLFWKRFLKIQSGLILDWLIRFHRKTHQSNLKFDDNSIKKVLQPIKKYMDNKVTDSQFKKRYDLIMERLTSLVIGSQIPLVIVHGDFRVDNILLLKNEISGVLDWEMAKPSSFGLFDLFSFWARQGRLICNPLHSRLEKDAGMTYKSFEITFFKNTEISGLVKNTIERYSNTFNIKSNTIRLLFLLWLIEFWGTFDLIKIFFEREDNFII